MQDTWDIVRAWPLAQSANSVFLVAAVVELATLCVLSEADFLAERVPLSEMVLPAAMMVAGILVLLATSGWWTLELPVEAPTPSRFVIEWLCGFLVADASHFVAHLALHRVPLLRRFHAKHHEPNAVMHGWVATKVHLVEGVLINTALFWALFLFTHPLVMWSFAAVSATHSAVIHSGYDLGLPPPFLGAKHHEKHHERDSTKNMGNFLSAWDRLAGTYRPV
jgi:sterol desaturase/sphingolipid hydroxylase (fatty acid hydroxylase superfamily)